MDEKIYAENEINYDLEYVAKKLDWSPEDFRAILNLPPVSHRDFPNNEYLFSLGMKAKKFLRI
jgi:hypothetical protein